MALLMGVSMPAYATEINLLAPLIGANGLALQDCDKQGKTPQECEKLVDLTLGRLAAAAVDRNEPDLHPEQLVERGMLVMKIRRTMALPNSDGEVILNLEPKEIDLIKTLIAKFPQIVPSVVAQSYELLLPPAHK